MTSEQLMEAFQHLDDDIIEAVDSVRRSPAPVKKNWTKWIATAACVCLILTGIYAASNPYPGSDGSATEDMAIEESNAADQKDGQSEIIYLTLPDYNFSELESNIRRYNFSEHTTESKNNDGKEISITDDVTCTTDILPVYSQIKISSFIITMEDLAIFERQLSHITSYEIYEMYPSIDLDEAVHLLQTGKYLTLTDLESTPAENYSVEMVYLYEKSADLAIPYYHFYDGDVKDDSATISGWFVPAISEEYITNMPDNAIVE